MTVRIVNNSWRLTRSPSFDMGFNGAVNGGSYLFGESVSLIDFIKVHVFPPCSGWQLLIAHRLVPLGLALKWSSAGRKRSSLSSSSSLIAILFMLKLQSRSIAKC